MLAISVKQPHAGRIAAGEKTIEVRSWPTKHRGKLLICSSKSPADLGPAGVAMCIVEVVDCRPMKRADMKAACTDHWDEENFAWVLRLVRKVKHFKVKGSAAFYHVKVS